MARVYDSTVLITSDPSLADEIVVVDPASIQALPAATPTTKGLMTPGAVRQIGVSLGDYASPSDTPAKVDTEFRALLAGEQHIFIPLQDWTVAAATPFELRYGQVIEGINGGKHLWDPAAGILSKLKVPAGWSGDLFSADMGVAHVTMRDFLIDLTGASAANAGTVIKLDASTDPNGEEAQWVIRDVEMWGPFGRGVWIGAARRGVLLDNFKAFRNGGTACVTAIQAEGTDCTLDNCKLGAGTADVATGIRAWGSLTRIRGGDIWGWSTGIDTLANGHGVYIGGGVGIDRIWRQAIFLADGSSGTVDGVQLHSVSQGGDGVSPYIRCEAKGTWGIGDVNLHQDPNIANAANYAVFFANGGYADLTKAKITVEGGVGAGLQAGSATTQHAVRTSISGPASSATVGFQPTTYAASLIVDPYEVQAHGAEWRTTLGGDLALSILSTGYDGQEIRLLLTQDATGNRKITWDTAQVVAGPQLIPAPGVTTVVELRYVAASNRWFPTRVPHPGDYTRLLAGETTMDRLLGLQSLVALPVTATGIAVAFFTAETSETITQVRTVQSTAAATVTLSRIGIYEVDRNDEGPLLAATANDVALWATLNSRPVKSFAAPFAKVRGRRYGVAFAYTGTTVPLLTGRAAASNTAAAEYLEGPRETATLTASAGDLPANMLAVNLAAQATKFYAALLR